jgi:hypothetical protein
MSNSSVYSSRPPFFGYVKRSMNRAPSSNDTWWLEHQLVCGGKFVKVREPEDYGQKKLTKKLVNGKRDKTENMSNQLR